MNHFDGRRVAGLDRELSSPPDGVGSIRYVVGDARSNAFRLRDAAEALRADGATTSLRVQQPASTATTNEETP